jgi:broad specificity phosphatase PhoE
VDHPTRGRALSGDGAGPSDGPIIPDGLDATLVLLRHGESRFIVEGRFQGQADTPLSETGFRQAELAARRLARPHDPPALPIPAGRPLEIVHSPLVRTRQTADAVADAIAAAGAGPAGGDDVGPVSLRPDPGFLEIGQGEWEGLHRSVVAERYGEQLAAWRRRPTEAWAPGGESIADVQARIRPALRGLLASLASGRTPGTVDRSPVRGYETTEAEQPWSLLVAHDGVFKVTLLTLFDLPLERFWMWMFELCGISVIEFVGGRPALLAHGLTEHLAPRLDERAQAEAEERQRSGAL